MSKEIDKYLDLSTENIKNDKLKYEISGRAINFGKISRNRNKYEKGCIASGKYTLPALWNHNTNEVIGKVIYTVTENYADFVIKFNMNIDKAKEVYELVSNKDVTNVSIGMHPIDHEFIRSDESSDGKYYFSITEGELLELSVVPTPGFADAKINKIETLGGQKMTVRELKEQRDAALEKANELNEHIAGLENKIHDSEEPSVTQKLKEDLNQATTKNDELNKMIENLNDELVKKEMLNQQLKKDIKTSNATQKEGLVPDTLTISENKKNELFEKALRESASLGTKLGDTLQKIATQEGFTGTVADLFPTNIAQKIEDKIKNVGTLSPFINELKGIENWSQIINTGEELALGHAGNKATKVEQSNVLETIKIVSQYIYKYIEVPREQLDQPTNILYDYIVMELIERTNAAIERAIVIGDGLLANDTKKITSYIPMINADDISRKNLTLSIIDESVFDQLEGELIDDEQLTVFVMHKKTFLMLKQAQTDAGNKALEYGSVVIEGKKYHTLDGNLIVTKSFMPFPTNGSFALGSTPIVAFKSMSYTSIKLQNDIEFLTNFQLKTNTNEFLSEIRAGGNATKPSCIAIAKTPSAGTLGTTATGGK